MAAPGESGTAARQPAPAQAVVATIGYERATPDELVATLGAAGVACVIDVRAVAASRKPGFSKTALAQALARAGIAYRHLPGLGTPKPGRDAARAGRLAEFRRIYERHLRTPEARAAMAEAADLARRSRCCLLCLEREAARCHRSRISAELAATHGFTVADLVIAPCRPGGLS